MSDAMLVALKIAAILISGGAGILGLLGNYKDPSGRLTAWGKVALLTAILSIGVAATIQSVESSRQNIKEGSAREAQRQRDDRALAILTEIQRMVHPLTDISVL